MDVLRSYGSAIVAGKCASRANKRAYVAGLEWHKMEEWRTNAAVVQGWGQVQWPTDSTHPWVKDGAQVIPNFILKRRFPPIS
jgi:hypothetical protein